MNKKKRDNSHVVKCPKCGRFMIQDRAFEGGWCYICQNCDIHYYD